MQSNDEFARELFEDAKNSVRQARASPNSLLQQRHLRHSLVSAFSFLELQIDLIAQHFEGNPFFSVHEQGILTQRDVAFDKGEFKLKKTERFSRLPDRMQLLQSKFKKSKLTERSWWGRLNLATTRRNSIAHPRRVVVLEIEEVESDLNAVLDCANDLFVAVFSKGLPYAAFGIKPKSA